jgi:hypothetical protein
MEAACVSNPNSGQGKEKLNASPGQGERVSESAQKKQRSDGKEQSRFTIEPICDFPALHRTGQCGCQEREILINSPSSTEESALLEPAAQLEAGAGQISEEEKDARKLFEQARLRLDLAQISHNSCESIIHLKEKKLREAKQRVESA